MAEIAGAGVLSGIRAVGIIARPSIRGSIRGVEAVANSAQARKRARQAVRRRAHNASLRSRMRTSVKRVVRALNADDAEAADAALKRAEPILDGAAGKGLIHKNKAARHKSRLNARLKALRAA